MIDAIVAALSTAASISGVTAATLLKGQLANHADVRYYVRRLEGKKVLFAPFDKEVHGAVVKSLEEIKRETENLQAKITDEAHSVMLLSLVLSLNTELMALHAMDVNHPDHNKHLYLSIQTIRKQFADVIVILCAVYRVTLARSPLAQMVADLGFRPKKRR